MLSYMFTPAAKTIAPITTRSVALANARRLAMAATRANRQFVEEQRERSAKKRQKMRDEAEAQAKRMSELKLTIEARAGEKDKLFGSVTSADISEAMRQQGYEISKKQVVLHQPIHTLGTHEVEVEVFPQVKTKVTIEVVQKT